MGNVLSIIQKIILLRLVKITLNTTLRSLLKLVLHNLVLTNLLVGVNHSIEFLDVILDDSLQSILIDTITIGRLLSLSSISSG